MITAPPASAWSEKKNHWLMFYLVDGLTVTGNSTRLLDGIGQTWWVDKCKADNDVRKPNSTLKDFFSLIPPCIWQVPFDLPIFFAEKVFNGRYISLNRSIHQFSLTYYCSFLSGLCD